MLKKKNHLSNRGNAERWVGSQPRHITNEWVFSSLKCFWRTPVEVFVNPDWSTEALSKAVITLACCSCFTYWLGFKPGMVSASACQLKDDVKQEQTLCVLSWQLFLHYNVSAHGNCSAAFEAMPYILHFSSRLTQDSLWDFNYPVHMLNA